MSQEIEIEFKNLLTEPEFENIRRHFHLAKKQFTPQHNHYFDTEDFMLKKQNCALRVREKKGRMTFTLKQPHRHGLLETHQPITSNDFETMKTERHFPEGEVTRTLRELNIVLGNLVLLGTLSTKRAELDFRNGLLVLDHSFYVGTEDYELEYECKERSSGEKVFFELLHQFQIPKRKTENKIKRMFQKLNSPT